MGNKFLISFAANLGTKVKISAKYKIIESCNFLGFRHYTVDLTK